MLASTYTLAESSLFPAAGLRAPAGAGLPILVRVFVFADTFGHCATAAERMASSRIELVRARLKFTKFPIPAENIRY
jgi:hypothetical protein